MYTFKINKSPESSSEEFELAINCARECIGNVLENEYLITVTFENIIVIKAFSENQSISMTLSECKEKIKGCFLNSSGKIYPEFKNIDPN